LKRIFKGEIGDVVKLTGAFGENLALLVWVGEILLRRGDLGDTLESIDEAVAERPRGSEITVGGVEGVGGALMFMGVEEPGAEEIS